MNTSALMMKLFEFHTQDDFGKEFYLTLLKCRNWSLFQSVFYFPDYGRTFPYLSLIFGSSRLFEISFQFLNFGFTLSFFSRAWYED